MKIEELLARSEDKTLEFKENSLAKDKILAGVIAFANSSGGQIIIGVKDKTKEVIGVDNLHLEEEKLSSLIYDSVTPGIIFSVEILPWRHTHLLIIDVPMSNSRPHFIKSKGLEKSCYVRVGSTNRLADVYMRESVKRSASSHSFDEESCPGANEADIDLEIVYQKFAPLRDISKNEMLSLGLFNQIKGITTPSIGGIITFGKKRHRFFADAWIQAGCFQGTNKTIILDSLDIRDDFVGAIEQSLNFIRKHLKVGLQIEDVQHTEQWEIPKAALREAILNAIIHADYILVGFPIRIAIFDDRIEFENPGLLPSGLSIEDIQSGISKIRNRVIARVFRELKQSEQWGSGVGRMIDVCRKFGLPDPKFEEVVDRFRVTFYRKSIKEVYLDDLDKAILDFLKQQKTSSTSHIAKAFDYSERSIRPRLAVLIEKGFIHEIAKSKKDPHKKFVLSKSYY